MNLRELCQIRGYPVVLLTTYNFDPLFFERVVMTDLLAGGARRVTVLADAEQAHEAIGQARGQLLLLGRKYRVIPISAGGAFHPKICVRLGQQGAIVACGSHNLSRSGWLGRTPEDKGSGNREVSVAWRVEPGSPSAADLRSVLLSLSKLIDIPASRWPVTEMLDTPWLADARPHGSRNWSWVVTGVDGTLADVLENRWRGRQFNRLRLVTGSTDDRGAMIRWAARTFGVRQAVVEVDLDRCGFTTSLLKGIPADLRLSRMNGHPRTHLKVALFESSTGCAAVLGSANCSGAAWLRPADQSGNIESVLIFDKCESASFRGLFRKWRDGGKDWSKLDLAQPPAKTDTKPTPGRQLKQIQLLKGEKRLLATLSPSPHADEQVIAVLGGQRVCLHRSPPEGVWVGTLAAPVADIATPFAWVEIGDSAGPTNAVWVDDTDSLDQAVDWRMPLRAIRDLSQHAASDGYRALLNDLRLLSETILNKTEEFPDSLHGEHQKTPNSPGAPARPLEPGALIRSLSELRDKPLHSRLPAGHEADLSLSGVIRLLFAKARDGDMDDDRYDPTHAEAEKSLEEREREESDDLGEGENQQGDEPSSREKQRLLRQLNEFADKLASPEFAARCTARQLQQAVAYPLAVVRFASQGPWGDDIVDGLSKVVVRTIEILLHRNVRAAHLGPLLTEVQNRYRAQGRVADFNRIIGDGLLWLVLAGSLSMIEEEPGKRFELNLLIGDVANCQPLIAMAVPDRLTPLARLLGRAGNSLLDLNRVRQTVEALKDLEVRLDRHFKKYDSALRVFDDKPGDWLWRPVVGFAQVLSIHEDRRHASMHIRSEAREVQKVRLDFYINLRQIQGRDTTVRELLATLE